jgi:hypothetical protein
MNTAIVNATEYRDFPLAMLTEFTTNPRRIFEENALKERPKPSALRAFFRPCWCGLSVSGASRSSSAHDAIAPHR